MHAARKPIQKITVEPHGVPAPAGAVEAVENADVVVLSPGSLFTSTIPALLGGGVREALAAFSGPVAYVANVMTQPGETDGFSVSDHLRAIADHVGPVVTDTLVHCGGLPPELVERYRAEGSAPVAVDREEISALGVRVRGADLISDEVNLGVRHDPARLAEEVCEVALVRL